MKNKISLDERRVLIASCGTKKVTQKNNKLERSKRVMYCGYFWGDVFCEKCRQYETSKRASVIKENVEKSFCVFKCVVENDATDWKRLYKSLNRKKVEYNAIPQKDGSVLVVSDGNPNHRDFMFEEISKNEAVRILTRESNLFPTDKDGNTVSRRGSKGWRLTRPDTNNEDGIEIKHLYAVFESQSHTPLLHSSAIEQLSLFANTWDGGEVNEDNAQDFVTHGDSLYIEMHIAAGWVYNIDKSFIRTKFHSIEEIKQWKARHRVVSEDVIYGNDGNGIPYDTESFPGINSKLYSVLMGDIPLTDRLSELEHHKQEKSLREELGDLYDYFYPEHEYNEEEQASLDKVVVY